MNTKAQHLLLDIWLKEGENVEATVDAICGYVHLNFNVVEEAEKIFEPQGRTIVFILSESHFSVHTYPEHNYITLDLYICNMGLDLHKIGDEIVELCSIKEANCEVIKRG